MRRRQRNERRAPRVLLFWTYDATTDKTTLTDGDNAETYTGRDLFALIRDFKEMHGITIPADLVRY